jgi:hypothetical protein
VLEMFAYISVRSRISWWGTQATFENVRRSGVLGQESGL